MGTADNKYPKFVSSLGQFTRREIALNRDDAAFRDSVLN